MGNLAHADSADAGLVGDKSFQPYFASVADFHAAMQRAKDLERRGMYRRAWRVRLNLDGVQPVVLPVRPAGPPAELTEREKKILYRKRKRLNELKIQIGRLQDELEEHGIE